MAKGLNFEEFWKRWTIDVNIKCLVPALPFLAMSTLGITWSILILLSISKELNGQISIFDTIATAPWTLRILRVDKLTGLGEFSFRLWITRNRGWNPAGVQKHPCDGHGHRWHGNVVWSFVAANHVLPQFATSKVWCRRFLSCLFAYSFTLQEWSQIELA